MTEGYVIDKMTTTNTLALMIAVTSSGDDDNHADDGDVTPQPS